MMRSKKISVAVAVVSALTISLLTSRTIACPFCSAVSQTFSEEIATMDAVAIARIVTAPDPKSEEPSPKATFHIEKVIKGDNWAKVGQTVEILYYGDGNRDRTYLLMGSNAPTIMWSSPLGLSPRAEEYILHLLSLPSDAARLAFFQEYLEDEDEMLARDAYDEFAKIPYKGVIELKENMHHDRLIAWIKNPDVPATRRRLYFTMLGICGTTADVPFLEELMKSTERKQKAGLDALIACHLLLSGEGGLSMIDDLFLKDPNADYADTYAAIMAIRFHGSEVTVIPKSRLVRSLRHILERPSLADLVIPDLARWEDWEVMPTLVELFKSADEKSSWVRVPVINYLRSCPMPEAKTYIDELSKIDPDAVKRAQTFFPFNEIQPAKSPPSQTQPAAEAATPKPTDATSVTNGADDVVLAQPTAPEDTEARTLTVADSSELKRERADDDLTLSALEVSPPGEDYEVSAKEYEPSISEPTFTAVPLQATPPVAAVAPVRVPNLFVVWGVPLVSGIVLFFVLRLILGVQTAQASS